MDYNILRNELINDPLSRGYVGMTDQQVSDSLNTANRPVIRTSVDTWEVLEATVDSEYTAMSTANKTRYQIFISAGTLDPSRPNTKAAFASMFGPSTQTRTNLLALQLGTPISRATELGLPFVDPHNVTSAREMV